MVKRLLLGMSLLILLNGCSTPPHHDVWNMSTSPEKSMLDKKTKTSHLHKAFSQEPKITLSNKVKRYVSQSDVEVSIILSLIHYNLYSYNNDGKYTLDIDVKSLSVRGGELDYSNEDNFQNTPDDVTVELEISYQVTSNKTKEIVFERIIKTKHQNKISKKRNKVTEYTFKENYDLFIQNFIKENL